MPNITAPPDRFAADPLVLAQDGLATVHQLHDIGCASYAVADHCRPAGPWQRVLPRVILLHSTPPTPHQRLRAALLYAGPNTLLTGPAALALYGIVPLEELERVDVLVTHFSHPRSYAYARIHHTHRPEPRVPVQNLACVPLPRALEDARYFGAT
ncbi:hypothetical protein ACFPM3_33275 [Streptomyces coeruleoprunus]|uniref:Uncharacterized protein n=1 Tax=Streptomyces coeruleoprunus TaxID=285563 RepID=A0ABV9XS13_9ACTN